MLKLRKVELLGFKSFCEKTSITFSGGGITCIVGPNGCGKSNVVDAISWVLGEQSHKMLRAERMADCIFNGTVKRPPLGIAEVTLTLADPELAAAAALVLEGEIDAAPTDSQDSDSSERSRETGCDSSGADSQSLADSAKAITGGFEAISGGRRKPSHKPALTIKPGEVVIGRRLFRSGQSEYLLNGRVARLRDIQQLFMGIGLGPDSYAIIEQGRIGQILSSKPMDRRSIIEEAAGVTIYKSRRRLAEAKLEASKANLARLHDILSEVEKQLGSLKRQASKARRYGELRDEFRGRQRRLFGSRAVRLMEGMGRLEGLVGEETRAEQAGSGELHEREIEHDRLSARLYEIDGELKRLQDMVSQCALELDRAENRAAYNREQMATAESRLERLASDAEREADQVLRLVAEQAERETEISGLEMESQARAGELDGLLSNSAISVSNREFLERRIEEIRAKGESLAKDLAASQAGSEVAKAAWTRATEEIEARRDSQRKAAAAAGEGRNALAAAKTGLDYATDERKRTEDDRATAHQRQAFLKSGVQDMSSRLEGLRRDHAAAEARRQSLQQILEDRAYSADAVQRLFSAGGMRGGAFHAAGLLADYAEVSEEHEAAVEQFLQEELEYVVVETFDQAREGVSLLRGEVGGRATFFVDSLRNLNAAAMPMANVSAPAGTIARMDELIEFRDPLGPAAKYFLPKLRSAFLVASPAAAQVFAEQNPSLHFVTVDGSCYQGRTVSGGRRADAGPLTLKRELRVKDLEVSQMEQDVQKAAVELAEAEESLRVAESGMERCLLVCLDAEKNLVGARHRYEQCEAEMRRLESESAARQRELERFSVEMENAQRQAEDAQRRFAEARTEREGLEQQHEDALRQLSASRLDLESQSERAGFLRAESAKLSERAAAARESAARIRDELQGAIQRLEGIREQQLATSGDRAALQANAADQGELAEKFRAEKLRLEEQSKTLDAEWKQMRERTISMGEDLRSRRDALEALRSRRGQHEVERARHEADLEHLREMCRTELALEPEALAQQTSDSMNAEETAIAEQEYAEIHTRLEGMGPINMMALDEFRECEERNAFLLRERDDLVESVSNIQQAIRELDEISRAKFDEAFEAINRHFAEAFRTLFGGGTGEMRLTEPDSSGDSGVDIAAQPPGKRLQNVLLLSGGEKALAALALLIAVFRYRPSPFCILDEVDAPLDEANVGRFNQMFKQLGEQTQFIIITHNRRTMEMGSMLYGVTMQEPGVSRLVSVEWDKESPDAQLTAA